MASAPLLHPREGDGAKRQVDRVLMWLVALIGARGETNVDVQRGGSVIVTNAPPSCLVTVEGSKIYVRQRKLNIQL